MTSPFGKPGKDDEFSLDQMPEPGEGFRIPAGPYVGRLLDITKETSKANNPMWVFHFVIVEGQYEGRDFRTYCALTPKAMWKLNEVLNALGLGVEPGEKLTFSRKDAIGTGVILRIQDSMYNDREQSELKTVEAHPKGAGYKPKGSMPAVKPRPAAEEVAEAGEDDGAGVDDDDDPPPPPRKPAKPAPAPAGRGKERSRL